MILATTAEMFRKWKLPRHEYRKMIDMINVRYGNDELRFAHLLKVHLRLEKFTRDELDVETKRLGDAYQSTGGKNGKHARVLSGIEIQSRRETDICYCTLTKAIEFT